ncbi:MAG: hypothetical protein H6Q17_570 [Bacteroidetes bacterium]|nr:hypothetical protein [Bacteroidota bacterium]
MDIIAVSNTFIYKSLRYIKSKFSYDAHQSPQIAPWGDDSVPVEGTKGVKAFTSTKAIHIVLGFFNRNHCKAAAGEKRIFSTNAAGTEQVSLWLKNDGSFKIECSDGFTATYDLTNKRISFSGDCIAGVDGISLVNHVHDTLTGVTTPPFNPTV